MLDAAAQATVVDTIAAQRRNDSLNEQMRTRQLRAIEVVGDGNCFYRALSVSLHGHQNNHSILRASIADHLRLQAATASPEDRDALLKRADVTACNGTWASEDTIVAAAEYLGRNIEVYVAANQCSPLCYAPSASINDRPTLLIAFYEPGHFRSVVSTSLSHKFQSSATHNLN